MAIAREAVGGGDRLSRNGLHCWRGPRATGILLALDQGLQGYGSANSICVAITGWARNRDTRVVVFLLAVKLPVRLWWIKRNPQHLVDETYT